MRTGLLFAAFLLLVDQATKLGVLALLTGHGGMLELTGFFNLVVVWNRGVSFGMLSDFGDSSAMILSGISLVVVVALLVWLRRVERIGVQLAIGAIMGGAIGNVVDRVRFGAVFDFLDFHVAQWHWPAFNVADSAIVLGVAYLLLDGLLTPQPRRSAEGEDTK
ncbi:MAG: signal peptidase II [Rhodospirillaceae bacterium]|nr:signal peptidase II [Rhodospirillaceae bacterium]